MSCLRILWDRIWSSLIEVQNPPRDYPPFFIPAGAPDPIHPLYFVLHPDGGYSVADPQPTLGSRSIDVELSATAKQLRFLLEQSPMIDAGPIDVARACALQHVRFVYIHPKTFAKMTKGPTLIAPAGELVTQFLPSKTKWVITSLMPEGRLLLSQTPMPGIENLLTR